MATLLNEPVVCPHCAYAAHFSTCLTDEAARPHPGDFNVCLGCAAVLRFDKDLQLIPSSLEESANDKEVQHVLRRLVAAVQNMKPMKRGAHA